MQETDPVIAIDLWGDPRGGSKSIQEDPGDGRTKTNFNVKQGPTSSNSNQEGKGLLHQRLF